MQLKSGIFTATLIVSLNCACLAVSPGALAQLSAQPGASSMSQETAGIPLPTPTTILDATFAWDALAAKAQLDGDPRVRAILAWRNPTSTFPEGSKDLVAMSRSENSTSDPLLLMLFATGCDQPGLGCDALPFATRWTALDGDNAAAWMHLWSVNDRLGDSAAADAALTRAIAAPQWRDYTLEMTSALVAIVPTSADVLIRLNGRLQTTPRVVGIVNALYREMLTLCRLPSKQSQCMALTDRMAAAPVSLLEATVVASLSAHFGAPPEIAKERRERVEAYEWAIAQEQPAGILESDPKPGAAAVIAYFDRIASTGEVVAGEQILAARRVTVAQAAARYRAARASKTPGPDNYDRGAGLKMPGT